jgi:hypothetical protein
MKKSTIFYVIMTISMAIVFVLLLVTPSVMAEAQRLTFEIVSNPVLLEQWLRNPLFSGPMAFEDDIQFKFGNSSDVTLEWDTTATPNQFKIDAVTTTAGYAILLKTTNGGIQLNADGAANGDISIDAADDLTLTAADDLTLTAADDLTLTVADDLTLTAADDLILTAAGNLDLAVTGNVTGNITGDGTDTLTGYLTAIEVEDATSEAVLATDSGKVFATTAGKGAVTYTLPAAAVGLTYTFVDVSAAAGDDLIIQAVGDDTINGGTAAKKYSSDQADAVPCSVTLTAISDTQWVITAQTGDSCWKNDNS